MFNSRPWASVVASGETFQEHSRLVFLQFHVDLVCGACVRGVPAGARMLLTNIAGCSVVRRQTWKELMKQMVNGTIVITSRAREPMACHSGSDTQGVGGDILVILSPTTAVCPSREKTEFLGREYLTWVSEK